MMFIKYDYANGGFSVLEIKESKKIGKFTAIVDWKVVFQYGNLKDINFKLNEQRSAYRCYFVREDELYNDFNEVAFVLKGRMDDFVKMARDLKEDTQFIMKEAQKDIKEFLLESESEIKRLDKQIRDFSNLDIERELEKRGLIY